MPNFILKLNNVVIFVMQELNYLKFSYIFYKSYVLWIIFSFVYT